MEGPRELKKDELRSAAELANYIFRHDSPYRMEDEFPLLFSYKNLENMRVFVDEGKVVSLVGMSINDAVIMGCKIRSACIGSVCTHPEYRNRGLATILLEDATRKAVQKGASLMLISGNRGLYRRLGCVDAGIYKWYAINKSQVNTLVGDLTLRKYKEDDISDIVKLHQLEPIRFIRTYDHFKILLGAKRLCDEISETYVVMQDNHIVAYFSIQLPKSKDLPLTILELAGSRASIVKILRNLMKEVGTETAIIRAPSADVELEHLMISIGAKRSTGGFMGTVKLIDIERFLNDIDTYITEVIGEEKRRELSIKYDSEKSELSFEYMKQRFDIRGIDQITTFVFGSVEKQRLRSNDSELIELLNMAFPMPLVDYGLNYI
ncbi:MAG: GNAT family N-acetyltransferase [Thermoproteota archaeon]